MFEIKIPDAKLQFAKTEARRRVREKITDPETGEVSERYRWVREFVGQGEDRRIVRWKELFERISDYVQNHTLAECKAIYEHLIGDDYEGVSSKKAVAVAYIKWLFGVELDETETVKEILRQLMEELGPSLGRWGLGCPATCGRFWEFKPTVDLDKFELNDDIAMEGMDREGNPTRGYLDWNPQPDGTITFRCDKCGAEVKLIL